jgi:hypothetical protein
MPKWAATRWTLSVRASRPPLMRKAFGLIP